MMSTDCFRQDVDNDNGSDDRCRNALMHAKEKASKDDEERVVRRVVVNKDVYEDVDVNYEVVVVEDGRKC